jgi:hypothetical protein
MIIMTHTRAYVRAYAHYHHHHHNLVLRALIVNYVNYRLTVRSTDSNYSWSFIIVVVVVVV